MAPTQADSGPPPTPSQTNMPITGYWTRSNIALTIVFGVLTFTITVALLAFLFHQRSRQKKLAKSHSDKASLLNSDDKDSMFSQSRHSIVSLYLQPEGGATSERASQETTQLIPLHVTPAEEIRGPLDSGTSSSGSGVSRISKITIDTTTLSFSVLSPVSSMHNEDDWSVRSDEGPRRASYTGRLRSTSNLSKPRYYESTPSNIDMSDSPKIVHTTSY